MACTTQPVQGHELRLLVAPEVTASTPISTIDATIVTLDYGSADLGPEEAQPDRESNDRQPGRDGYTDERVLDIFDVTAWSVEKSLRPSGTKGTAPDDDALWEAAFGTGTNDPGVSEAYTILGSNCKTLTIYQIAVGGEEGQRVYGALIDTVVIALEAGADPKVTFSGTARYRDRGYKWVADEIVADEAGPSTFDVLGEDHQYFDQTVALGHHYTIEDERVQVTAIDRDADEMTFTRALDGTVKAAHAKGTVAFLYVPTFSSTGDPISPTEVTVSRDGGTTDLTVKSGTITYNGNLTYLDDVEQGEERRSIVTQGEITTEWEMTFQGRDDTRQAFVEDHRRRTTVPLLFEIGDTAGSIVEVSMPLGQVTNVTAAMPTGIEDRVEFTVTGIAKSTTASQYDAISVTYK